MSRLRAEIEARGAHPARTVVLLPYAQLMPLARTAWASEAPTGFAPRFETTMNWAGQAGFAAADDDLSFDRGRDLLTARAWLERAGLATHAEALAGRLVDAAWQLADVVSAIAPPRRSAWAADARHAVGRGLEAPALALEAAVARIAVEWAAASAYAGDVLLRNDTAASLDLLVVLEGLQAEPMAQALAALLGARALTLPLDAPVAPGSIALHAAADPSHEAEMAAACVVRHVDAGRRPVALAAIDRVLTRRIRAMLDARGVVIRDETGWKLSTTRAAAQVMGALRGCAFQASSDAVIDWLKNTPAAAPRTVSALERRVRREGLRDWRAVASIVPDDAGTAAWPALVTRTDGWREAMQPARLLPRWLEALRELLQDGGAWGALEADAAGARVLDTLGLREEAQALWQRSPHAGRRMGLGEFTAWCNEALEAASFVPPAPADPDVVILPFNQLLGRTVAALVMPGCDEVRLAPSPEPPGAWTAAQRLALGLPSRGALEAALRAGWRNALGSAHGDVLWRTSDDQGEPVLPSPLVQALRLAGAAQAPDPRAWRPVVHAPVPRPLAVGADLPVLTLSASAYEDLRRCPYRFFALRQLGLQEASEIDAELDKRDFGNWLHRVLGTFHEVLQGEPAPPGPVRTQLLERAAQAVTREMRLDDGEFLPFAAAWPQVRDGYLAWLEIHEAKEGASFAQAESEREIQLGPVRLVGRIDRIDRLPDGRLLVMDYKTEADSTTLSRISDPGEDTQLAFYAALLDEDTLRAAYVNVGERGRTALREQDAVVEARDALVHGILADLEQLALGAPLAALGEGKVCETCSARGLCRRDFWMP